MAITIFVKLLREAYSGQYAALGLGANIYGAMVSGFTHPWHRRDFALFLKPFATLTINPVQKYIASGAACRRSVCRHRTEACCNGYTLYANSRHFIYAWRDM